MSIEGNNYWEFREKHGRDHKYTPESLWLEAVDYFNFMIGKPWDIKESIKSGELSGKTMSVPTQRPFSIKSFCIYADITYQTFLNYGSKEGNYIDFFEVITRIRDIIETNQFEGATVGAYNANIISKTLGLVEKRDLTTGGDKINDEIDYNKLSDKMLNSLEDIAEDSNEENN